MLQFTIATGYLNDSNYLMIYQVRIVDILCICIRSENYSQLFYLGLKCHVLNDLNTTPDCQIYAVVSLARFYIR